MHSANDVLSTLSISCFAACIALWLHLLFFSSSLGVTRTSFAGLAIYCSLILVFDPFTHMYESDFELFSSSEVGALLGFIAGFYIGYGICVFFDFRAEGETVESSPNSTVLCFVTAYLVSEMCRLSGKFLPIA